jgi:methylthioribose-1-phosphate isomerase
MKTVEWVEGRVRLIDQTRLPNELIYIDCRTPEDVAEAIVSLRVRGAPAIGVAAGYGLVLAGHGSSATDLPDWWRDVDRAADLLRRTRPTAVNLARALDVIREAAASATSVAEGKRRSLEAAHGISEEDQLANRRMGRSGADLIPETANVLTHCNTGGLATVEYGTALGVVRAAHAQGKAIHVWVDETRPALQGARLTAWELLTDGIPHTVIVDSAAAFLMQRGQVDVVIVGADRVAANGDVANKIGTYSLAVLARAHRIPFYVVAPTSTIDLTIADGRQIPIEERNPDEIKRMGDRLIAPARSPALNLAFDVTPHDLITAIVTESGVARSPYDSSLAELMMGRREDDGKRVAGNSPSGYSSLRNPLLLP